MDQPPFALGAKPRTVKATDYHADSFASAIPTPASVPIPVSRIYMQNQVPECGAELVTGYLNLLFGFVGSPEFTWKCVRHIDHLSPDEGSESITLAVEAKTVGTCDFDLMPENSQVSNAVYADYSTVTPAMIANAAPRRIGNYAFIDNPTMQEIKDNIFDHKAVGLRVACGDHWWKNGWSESAVCPLAVGKYVSDHFILATAFDEKFIHGPNSWSKAWGKQGMYYFDESYIPYVRELIIFIPPTTPSIPSPAKYQFTTDFGYGQKSADVHAFQVRMGVTPTGYFGFLTLIALVRFKISNVIFPINGTVDEKCRTILNSAR